MEINANEIFKVKFEHKSDSLEEAAASTKDELKELVKIGFENRDCVTMGIERIYNNDKAGLAARLTAIYLLGKLNNSIQGEIGEMKAIVEVMSAIVKKIEDGE